MSDTDSDRHGMDRHGMLLADSGIPELIIEEPSLHSRLLRVDGELSQAQIDVLHGLTSSPRALPPWASRAASRRTAALRVALRSTQEHRPLRVAHQLLAERAWELAEVAGIGCLWVAVGVAPSRSLEALRGALPRPRGVHSIARVSGTDALDAVLPTEADRRALHELGRTERGGGRCVVSLSAVSVSQLSDGQLTTALSEWLALGEQLGIEAPAIVLSLDLRTQLTTELDDLDACLLDGRGEPANIARALAGAIAREQLGRALAEAGARVELTQDARLASGEAEHYAATPLESLAFRRVHDAQRGVVDDSLVVTLPLRVSVGGHAVHLRAGDTLLVARTYLGALERVRQIAARVPYGAGLALRRAWVDGQGEAGIAVFVLAEDTTGLD